MTDEIYGRLGPIFSSFLSEEQMGALNPDATMDDVEGWDSLSFLDMIMAIENEFGIRIDGLDAVNLTSIPNIIAYLQSNT